MYGTSGDCVNHADEPLGQVWKLAESTRYDSEPDDDGPVNRDPAYDDPDLTAESAIGDVSFDQARREVWRRFPFLAIEDFEADLLHVYTRYPTVTVDVPVRSLDSPSLVHPAFERIQEPDDGLFGANSAVALIPRSFDWPSVLLRPIEALRCEDDSFEAWSVIIPALNGMLDTELKLASSVASTAKRLIRQECEASEAPNV